MFDSVPDFLLTLLEIFWPQGLCVYHISGVHVKHIMIYLLYIYIPGIYSKYFIIYM